MNFAQDIDDVIRDLRTSYYKPELRGQINVAGVDLLCEMVSVQAYTVVQNVGEPASMCGFWFLGVHFDVVRRHDPTEPWAQVYAEVK